MIQGGDVDIELNSAGKDQAKKTGIYLNSHQREIETETEIVDQPLSSRENSARFDCIISSPLKRAAETARIIAKEINFTQEIILDENLKEVICGEISGKIYRDLVDPNKNYSGCNTSQNFRKVKNMLVQIENEVDPIRKACLLDSQLLENALCEIGHESITSAKERANNVLTWIKECSHKKIIIVGHSYFFEILRDLMFGIANDTLERDYSSKINNCSIFLVYYEGVQNPGFSSDKFRLVTRPNTRHLNFVI